MGGWKLGITNEQGNWKVSERNVEGSYNIAIQGKTMGVQHEYYVKKPLAG